MEKELATTQYRNQGRSSDIVKALHQYIGKEILIKLKNNRIIALMAEGYIVIYEIIGKELVPKNTFNFPIENN